MPTPLNQKEEEGGPHLQGPIHSHRSTPCSLTGK